MPKLKRESSFRSELKRDLEELFPDAFILLPDPNDIQGFPDILILIGDSWAALETKRSDNSHFQKNQAYYIGCLNELSFARIVYPENKEIVLDELQRAFRSSRKSCFSFPK